MRKLLCVIFYVLCVAMAPAWVQAQEHPVVVLARREGKGTEHAAKSVLLKVK